MALLFLVPHLLWQTFGRQAGLNLRHHVHTIKSQADTNEAVRLFVRSLEFYLNNRRKSYYGFRCQTLHLGYTLTYLAVKFLYIINTISQFCLLNAFLSFPPTTHGISGLRRLLVGEHAFESPRFPRVTMCDFMTRHLGSNQHWYAVQCNLPINIYNDRIFAAIWIWLIALTALNIISFVSWMIFLTHRYRLASIEKYLSISADDDVENDGLWPGAVSVKSKEFVNYLQSDGYVMFRIVAHNIDAVLAERLIQLLYKSYCRSARNHFYKDEYQL